MRQSETALVFFTRSVERDIREVRGDLKRRLKAGQMKHAVRGAVFLEKPVNLRGIPGFVAKLETVTRIIGQCFQKGRETFANPRFPILQLFM